jgi:hypothetical protein
LQYDYLKAYLAFFSEDPKAARGIAEKYADYPVDRWRKLFATVTAQLDEAEGKAARLVDKDDAAAAQGQLAATEPALDLTGSTSSPQAGEAGTVNLHYANLADARVSYYLMDVELLFSVQPFGGGESGNFTFVQPDSAAMIKLPAGQTDLKLDLPEKYRSSNVMVQVEAAGLRRSKACYANSLTVQTMENYGQVKVTQAKSGGPLAKVYVKVYAKRKGGAVEFYKDGYTDLRGRFDYATLSSGDLGTVDSLSLLILSEKDGAVVREVKPPNAPRGDAREKPAAQPGQPAVQQSGW